jgi:transposase
LQRLVRDRNTPQKVVWRARIVLLGADGLQAIATAVGKSVLTVRRWRRRYVAKGVEGLLKDATRPPRRKPLTAEKIKQVVHMTLHAKPADATHWSLSNMAAAAGLLRSSIQRIWSTHGLKPHLTETLQGFARPELRRQDKRRGRAFSRSPTRLWSFVSMKRAKYKPSTVLSPACP